MTTLTKPRYGGMERLTLTRKRGVIDRMSDRAERSQRRRGMLVVNPQRCHGCQSCMVACSLLHEGQVIPSLARLHIMLDPFQGEHQIHFCHQCGKAPCAKACPEGAIQRDPERGYWVVKDDLCTGCGLCVQACPFHALIMHPETSKALICDTCNGNPECVASCPNGALAWSGPDGHERP